MQVFPRALNRLPQIVLVALLLGGGAATGAVWYYFSPSFTQVGYAPQQPVPYSHRMHAGQLGIDCRYCHVGVEVSAKAVIPPTQTCMNCHVLIKPDSAKVALLRDNWKSGRPMEWVRVHRLPDHAYFDHSIHVNAGVGCVECHGRVDQMEVVQQVQPLSMGWCLECHRNPGPTLRPRDQVTNMSWQPPPGQQTVSARPVEPPQHCSGCHR